MTFEVNVSTLKKNDSVSAEFYERFNSEFVIIHNMKFRQIVDIEGEGEVKEMRHTCGYTPCSSNFITIPCHWSFEHMVETAKDCCKVLRKMYHVFGKEIPEFDDVNDEFIFIGYKVRMSW